jgi:F-type H+-transporting ATPase subunit beta
VKPNWEMEMVPRLSNSGAVVSVHGGVVEVRFDARLPPICSFLRAGTEEKIAIEVLSQLDAHRERETALTPTQGLARGMLVEDIGRPLQAPVGKDMLSYLLDAKNPSLEFALAPQSFHDLTQIKGAQNDHYVDHNDAAEAGKPLRATWPLRPIQ